MFGAHGAKLTVLIPPDCHFLVTQARTRIHRQDLNVTNIMIKCLPEEVQGKLRSGVAIPSLQQCVEELILNSVDAGATCVCVRMEMDAFKVQVIDNGAGMSAEDMEKVGRRYHTSKCSSVEDLENLRFYGFRGEAVASLVSLATLVQISSRVKSSTKTYVRIFKDGKGLDVFEAETARPSAGTTFVVCNFFHNMPVRRKRMDAVLEGERIRHRMEAISLMQPSVSFTLKNDCTGAMMVQLPKARNTYHRFVQIHGLGRAQQLGEIGYTGQRFEVTGFVGREGHYNNSLQFLYVNERLLLKTRIHKLLNFLLRRLRSSNQRQDSLDGQAATRSPKHKRSQELHAVYVINIKCSYSEYDVCLEPAKTLIEFKDWDGVLLCVEEAVKAFLSRENLVAEFSRDDLERASPQLFGTAGPDKEGSGSGIQATFGISTLDCTIGMRLASESVHRKRTGDSVLEDSSVQESVQMEREEAEEEHGQERIIETEQEKTQSHTKKECRDESQCESVTSTAELESVSDNNLREEEDTTFSKAGEGSQIVACMLDSVRRRGSEQVELPKEEEIRFNNTTSVSSVTLQDSSAQERSAESIPHGHTGISNRKISVSDPYVHDQAQTSKPASQRQNLPLRCEERSSASKRKISLIHSRCGQKDPAVPSKLPRVVSCQKLTLCKQSGSLDKFRRIYGKSGEPKLAARLPNDARLPEADSFVLNPPNIPLCQTGNQEGDIVEKEKSDIGVRSPAALSAFTKLESISGQSRADEKSLAAKLCHLKQHRAEITKCASRSSEDKTCLETATDVIQDNNNEHPCGSALVAEPNTGCGTNPPPDEREETTTSGDWLHHYDASAGKTVYVNKVTGLSRYENPTAEGPRALCTSDVTNVAVSVVSGSGEQVEQRIQGLISRLYDVFTLFSSLFGP